MRFVRMLSWIVPLSFVATMLDCSVATPSAVTLPPAPAASVSAPIATGRTRAYANEPLTCAASGAPCVYFIEDPKRMEWTATGEDTAHQELWLHRPGSPDRLLVESHLADTCETRLVAMSEPRFSPDGAHLFVRADCAAVTPSVREIDLGGGGARMLSDGVLSSIATREGALHLIVERHLLDLDHTFGDPEYGGRLTYRFDVDVATGKSVRVAGPLD